MPKAQVVFYPADPTTIRDEDRPALPAWWPLPEARELHDSEGNPNGRTPDQVRAGRALAEACEGPLDGQRQVMHWHDGAAPPTDMAAMDGSVVYRRDDTLSNKHVLAYRYCPGLSPSHKATMRAVAEGFTEYGKTYAEEARHDDTSAPGYAVR